ncbi:MAG: transposase [Treponema sp.]|jgi:hypothetical protein|nr:transposase [Treponema sp.]
MVSATKFPRIPEFCCCYRDERLSDRLERDEGDVEALKERVLLAGESCMAQTDLLTSLKGVSVFITIGIIGDIIEVSRFKDSKQGRSYLRSAFRMANSNTMVKNQGTNKKGRKLSVMLLTRSLND